MHTGVPKGVSVCNLQTAESDKEKGHTVYLEQSELLMGANELASQPVYVWDY